MVVSAEINMWILWYYDYTPNLKHYFSQKESLNVNQADIVFVT